MNAEVADANSQSPCSLRRLRSVRLLWVIKEEEDNETVEKEELLRQIEEQVMATNDIFRQIREEKQKSKAMLEENARRIEMLQEKDRQSRRELSELMEVVESAGTFDRNPSTPRSTRSF